MFPWANNVTFTTRSLKGTSGIWVLLVLPLMLSSGSRASSFTSIGYQSSRKILSTEIILSIVLQGTYLLFLWSVTFIRMRSLFLVPPFKAQTGVWGDCKPSCCWQHSITSESGSIPCAAIIQIAPQFQNSARLLTSRDLFPSSFGYFMTVIIKQLKGFLVYVKSKC